MAEVVNLRRARKARARAERALAADASRVAHGIAKRERDSAEAVRLRLERALDGARRGD